MHNLHKTKTLLLDLLLQLQAQLTLDVEEGMVDLEDAYYNELIGLIEEVRIAKEWEELSEVIDKAKTLEIDIAGWLAQHGRASLSLEWPKEPL